jgi:membrane associated rhomboid family serine protease
MIIPLRDYLPTRGPTFVNSGLIAANVLVYLAAYGPRVAPTPAQFQAVLPYTVIPAEISHGHALVTLLTGMFVHAGLAHIFGNMLFLYIFGNNVEDYLGHAAYLAFYLAGGIAGSLLQVAVDPAATIPSMGASGAIAGVLAAYLVLYPRARVGSLVILVFIPLYVRLPALVVIGFWALAQFLAGYAQLGVPGALEAGGVGYFAHIGGFISGLLLLSLLRPRVAPAR